MICPVCQQDVPKLTRHHIIPYRVWKLNNFDEGWVWEVYRLCRACHNLYEGRVKGLKEKCASWWRQDFAAWLRES